MVLLPLWGRLGEGASRAASTHPQPLPVGGESPSLEEAALDEDITPLDERIGGSVEELYNFGHATLDFLFEMSKLIRLLNKPDVRFDVAATEGRAQVTTARDFLRAYSSLTSHAIHLLEQADSTATPTASEERDSVMVQLNEALAAFNTDKLILDLNSEEFVRRTAVLGFSAYSGSISAEDRARYELTLATIHRCFATLHTALSAANAQLGQLIVALVGTNSNQPAD
jgi:hypothetical protein